MTSKPSSSTAIVLGFALSGAAALMYQVCWQRLLFAAFGTDAESVTVIVSVFMLGLGIGSLVGGWIADRMPLRLLAVFIASEIGIAVYGMISVSLLLSLAAEFAGASRGVTAAVCFAALLPPTVLMGATLPILVAYINRSYVNVGRSIGELYSWNTFGAASGTFLVVFVLFDHIPLNYVILFAVALNISVALLVYIVSRRMNAY